MPRCPSCGRGGFKDPHAVAMHMSQPTSGCNTWVNNLVHLQESLPTLPTNSADNVRPAATASDSSVQMDTSEDHPIELDEYYEPSSQARGVHLGGFYSERFAGAGQTFGRGDTFMDRFDRDDFSDARKSNLYYPFACRNEWELALWLLRSGLSMKAMDTFLSLQIVCFCVSFL